MKFRKVAIVGVGLIGGSIALALKKHRLAGKVAGVCRHKESTLWALRHGIIDEGAESLGIVSKADLVVLAAPVETIIGQSRQVAAFAGEDCLITDVGSTKASIVSHLDRIFERFVGSHPLAGSEKRGAANADGLLFKGSLCILTPTAKTNKDALSAVRNLWEAIGARTAVMSPARHDAVISSTSHLPHAAACALISSVAEASFPFSAAGLRDTTRIAASDEALWGDIFLSNRGNLLKNLAIFKKNISALEDAVKANNRQRLRFLIRKARNRRTALEKLT